MVGLNDRVWCCIIRIGYCRGYVWKGRVVLGYGRTSNVD